jgi:hypothetical protein
MCGPNLPAAEKNSIGSSDADIFRLSIGPHKKLIGFQNLLFGQASVERV